MSRTAAATTTRTNPDRQAAPSTLAPMNAAVIRTITHIALRGTTFTGDLLTLDHAGINTTQALLDMGWASDADEVWNRTNEGGLDSHTVLHAINHALADH